MTYYLDGKIVDVGTYVDYLEKIICYAKEVIEGKHDDIRAHKILPVEAAVRNIKRNKERREVFK